METYNKKQSSIKQDKKWRQTFCNYLNIIIRNYSFIRSLLLQIKFLFNEKGRCSMREIIIEFRSQHNLIKVFQLKEI